MSIEEELRAAFKLIETAISRGDQAALSEYLASLDVTTDQPIVLLGILRAAGRARGYLPNWSVLRDAVKAKLQEDDPVNWQHRMRGLLG